MIHETSEFGHYSSIAIVGDLITKHTKQRFPTPEAAAQEVDALQGYSKLLHDQPLRTVGLLDCTVVGDAPGGQYRVRHTYPMVGGACLKNMPDIMQPGYIRDALQQIASMETLPHTDQLAVPIDPRARNFSVDEHGVIFTDLYPVLTRNGDQSFPLHRLKANRLSQMPHIMGTRLGAMATLLSSSINRGNTKHDKLRHILTTREEWAEKALPSNITDYERARLQLLIRTRFLPHLARMAVHKAGFKLPEKELNIVE